MPPTDFSTFTPKLDPEKFQIVERDGLRLIQPQRGTMSLGNAQWTKETIMLRSRVETLGGETVSQGYKKFFNLSSGPLDLQVTPEAILKAIKVRDAIATLKLDGSLLIRSVYRGSLMFRTRGSFDYRFLDNADEMEVFRAKYPAIFDTRVFEGYSLLFEWTSPRNVIVLKYAEPELTLIGAIAHTPDLWYVPIASGGLQSISDIIGVPLVTHFDLDEAGWDKLQLKLKDDPMIEGYVIRLHREQTLVKVKCEPYLTKHGLKSTLSREKLVDMWLQQGKPGYNEFKNNFLTSFDEETLLWAIGAISSLFDGVTTLNAILVHMKGKAAERQGWLRKDAAVEGIGEYGQTKRFSAYMNYWEGKAPSDELIKSILLQNTKQVEFNMFSETKVMGD